MQFHVGAGVAIDNGRGQTDLMRQASGVRRIECRRKAGDILAPIRRLAVRCSYNVETGRPGSSVELDAEAVATLVRRRRDVGVEGCGCQRRCSRGEPVGKSGAGPEAVDDVRHSVERRRLELCLQMATRVRRQIVNAPAGDPETCSAKIADPHLDDRENVIGVACVDLNVAHAEVFEGEFTGGEQDRIAVGERRRVRPGSRRPEARPAPSPGRSRCGRPSGQSPDGGCDRGPIGSTRTVR